MSSVNLLERNVKKILSSAGFDPRLRADLEGYEIDVYVEYKSERIIFECKQYERSSLTVRNLIHQWNGKQEELGVDRVVLVLVGVSVSEDDFELAEKRDIQIWRGEKVDSLLDDIVDGTTNLREKILLDLDLGSDEEIECRIEEIMESHNMQRDTAVKYLRGEITESELERLSEIGESLESEFSDGMGILSDRDIRRFKNDETYYGKPFREVVRKMGELGIQDKKVARLFVGDKGGTAHGEKYSKNDTKKIELLVEAFGYSFDTVRDFVFNKQPRMRTLRRAVNVRSERTDLQLKEIYNYLEGGFTVREIKKGQTERRDEDEDEASEPSSDEGDETESRETEGGSSNEDEQAGVEKGAQEEKESMKVREANQAVIEHNEGERNRKSYTQERSGDWSFGQTVLVIVLILSVVALALVLLS